MQYVRFGSTGISVSRLCLGTMTFGLQTDETVAFAIMDSAAAAGINFIDTADVYPLGGGIESAGRTEEIVGRWLRGRRSRTILATKAVGKVGPNEWDQGASRKHLLDAIDASLRRLGTDYVDLYQLHADDSSTPVDETIEALDIIVRSGRARYIGVSNFLAYRLALALGRADTLRLARFVCIQPRYNLLFREIERELLPLAAEQQLAVIPFNPLAGGLLTGKHKFDTRPADGTRFTLGTAADVYQKRYWRDREFTTVTAFLDIALEAGVAPATLAVAWVLANPVITAPIIGASRPDQLAATLAAVDYQLGNDVRTTLDALTVDYRRGDAKR